MSGYGGHQSRHYEVQVFKAMTNDTVERMRENWLRLFKESQKDDFYLAGMEARRTGQKSFKPIKLQEALAHAGDEPGAIDLSPALGAVRLRHTSAAQPLIADDSQINFSLPFEKNATLLEHLWNLLLKLEDFLRQADQGQKIHDLFRVIVHSLKIDHRTDGVALVDPEQCERMAYFLNDHKGQGFLSRFIELMPADSLRKFFFTCFVVIQDVNVDPRSQFAVLFVQTLATFLQAPVKPKWLGGFLRQATAKGVIGIVTDEFRAACFALVLRTIAIRIPQVPEPQAKFLKAAVDATIEKVVAELSAIVQADYHLFFISKIFQAIVRIQPESPLKPFFTAVSV
jgi:hypothetical protein